MRRSLRLIVLLIPVFLSSCNIFVKRSQFVYWQDSKQKSDTVASSELYVIRIQPFDIVDIRVASSEENLIKMLDPKLNINPSTSSGVTNPSYYNGFLVDAEGNVNLPGVGRVHLSGLTLAEAKELVRNIIMDKHLKDPFVEIKFLTYRITVLGAVARPGIVIIPNERANLVEAIAQAGDLTEFAVVDNVRVIRGNPKMPTVLSVDLTSIKSFSQEGYNLQPNDIVYIEPTKRRFILTNISATSLVLTVLNATALIFSLILLRR